MTPKEKAIELVKKFKPYSYYDAHDLTTKTQRERSNIESAKECALICVEEILNTSPIVHNDEIPVGVKPHEYWQQVKAEIEKL